MAKRKSPAQIVAEVGSTGPRAGLLTSILFALVDAEGESSDPRLEQAAMMTEVWSSVLYGAPLLPFLVRASQQEKPILPELDDALPDLPRVPVTEGALTAGALAAVAVRLGGVAQSDLLESWTEALGRALDGDEDGWAEMCSAPWMVSSSWSQPRSEGRRFVAWTPHPSPTLDEAAGVIEDAMRALITGPGCWGAAARHLQNQGGKRLRARLSLAQSADPSRAAAVEWVHVASLVVDDVMDEAPIRRGHPALHVRTDIPFALGVAGWITGTVLRAFPDLQDTVERMARGQLREWQAIEADEPVPVDAVIDKTSALFEAAVGPAGRALGLGFQLKDDLLDLVGDSESLGKPVRWDRGRTAARGRPEAEVRGDIQRYLDEALAQLDPTQEELAALFREAL